MQNLKEKDEDEFGKFVPWSESIIRETRRMFQDLPVGSFFRGFCILKCRDGRYGRVLLSDALSNLYLIREMDTDETIQEFKTVEDMIRSGWVAD